MGLKVDRKVRLRFTAPQDRVRACGETVERGAVNYEVDNTNPEEQATTDATRGTAHVTWYVYASFDVIIY